MEKAVLQVVQTRNNAQSTAGQLCKALWRNLLRRPDWIDLVVQTAERAIKVSTQIPGSVWEFTRAGHCRSGQQRANHPVDGLPIDTYNRPLRRGLRSRDLLRPGWSNQQAVSRRFTFDRSICSPMDIEG